MDDLYNKFEATLMWGVVIFTLGLMTYLAYRRYREIRRRRAHHRHRARRAMRQARGPAAEDQPDRNPPS